MSQNNLLEGGLADLNVDENKNDSTENTEVETDEIKDMKYEIENIKNEIEDIQMEIEYIQGDNKKEANDNTDDILIKTSSGVSDESKYLANKNVHNEIKEIRMEIEYIKDENNSEVNDNKIDNRDDIPMKTRVKSKDKFKEICKVWYGNSTEYTEIKHETNKNDVVDEIENEIEYIDDDNNKEPVNIVSDIVDRPNVIYFAAKNNQNLTNNDITNEKGQQISSVLSNEATGDNKLDIVKVESSNNQAISNNITLEKKSEEKTENLEDIYSVYDDDDGGKSVGETVHDKPNVSGSDKMHTIKSALEKKYRKIQEKLQNKFKTTTNMKRNKEVVIKMINDIDQVRKECLRNFDDIQEAQEVAQFLDKIKGEMEDLIKEKCDYKQIPNLEYNKPVKLEPKTSSSVGDIGRRIRNRRPVLLNPIKNNDLSEKKNCNGTPKREYNQSGKSNELENKINDIGQNIQDEGIVIKFNPIKSNSQIKEKLEHNKIPKIELKNKTDVDTVVKINHDSQEKIIMLKFNPIREKDHSSVIPKSEFNFRDEEIVLKFNPIKNSDLKREKNKYNQNKKSESKHNENKTGRDVFDKQLVMEFNPIKIYNLSREKVECNQIPKLNIVMRFNQIKNHEQANEQANNSSGNSFNSFPKMNIQDEWLMLKFNPIKDYDLTREKVEFNQIPKLNIVMRFNEIKCNEQKREQEKNCIPSIGQTIQDDWLLVKFNPIRNFDQVKENTGNNNVTKLETDSRSKESLIEIKFNPIKNNGQKRKSDDELNMNIKGHKVGRFTAVSLTPAL